MKFFRAVLIGLIIWVLGVSIFLLSYFFPIMKDLDFQANLVLSLVVLPLVWAGAWMYYQKRDTIHGLKLGMVLFATSALMDTLVTVPYLMVPFGGSYYSFFTAPGFWLIGTEFIITTVLFWYFRVKSESGRIINT